MLPWLAQQLNRPIGPAAVLFVPTGAIGAGLVEQALGDIFPERVRSEAAHGFRLLHLDNPRAARAFDPQHMALDVSESALVDRHLGLAGRARVVQQGFPHRIGHRIGGGRIGR